MKPIRWIALGGLAAGVGTFLLKRVFPPRRLQGKTVLITGGSRGLGLELARVCLDKGARVALVGRDEEALDRAVDLLGAPNGLTTFPCDVTDAGSVRAAVMHVSDVFGEIDVLIHNAGVITVGPQASMSLDDYRTCLDTHLWGAIHAVEAVLPSMRARKDGSIVLISSIGGKLAVPHLLPYSASKFALAGYGEGLHAELAKEGICVTSVYPGLMRTGSPRNADFKGDARKEYGWFSIADSLPFMTLSAASAARRIVSACEHGRAELSLVPFGKALMTLKVLAPELVASLFSMVNRALPSGEGGELKKGREVESKWSTSPLTALTRRAELRNNQR